MMNQNNDAEDYTDAPSRNTKCKIRKYKITVVFARGAECKIRKYKTIESAKPRNTKQYDVQIAKVENTKQYKVQITEIQNNTKCKSRKYKTIQNNTKHAMCKSVKYKTIQSAKLRNTKQYKVQNTRLQILVSFRAEPGQKHGDVRCTCAAELLHSSSGSRGSITPTKASPTKVRNTGVAGKKARACKTSCTLKVHGRSTTHCPARHCQEPFGDGIFTEACRDVLNKFKHKLKRRCPP